MYTQFFRLAQAPFSISPDPRYLFMSERHREALAHLLYGVDSGGGLVLLTGDIGTGKTTICRCFLEQVPASCNVAYIFNPKLTVNELLQAICEEFHVALDTERPTSVKEYIDALNRYLLAAHADGRNNVLIIDEAQNLSADVLEQLRLLTNLETNERKLLQIILIGQPELRTMLLRPELEQLAQRVIAHFHLTALSEQETASYIQHRLATAGLTTASPFQQPLMKQIHRLTNGVPRRINLLCDRALLGAYAKGTRDVDRRIVEDAAGELFINQRHAPASGRYGYVSMLLLGAGVVAIGAAAWNFGNLGNAVSLITGNASGTAQERRLDVTPEDMKKTLRISPEVPATSVAAATDSATASSKPSVASQDASKERNAARTVLRSEQDALRQLLLLWDAPATASDPCEAAAEANLHCHRSSGGLAELRQLDRPAALVMYDSANKPFYAILTALGDTHATLRAGDAIQEIELVELVRHFRGEFILLWRAPYGFSKPVALGDKGPGADWIATQLAKLNGVAPPAPDQPFSQKTVKLLRHFQQAHGLFVDGIAGPVTAMHINRVAGIEEPQLRAKAVARNRPAGAE